MTRNANDAEWLTNHELAIATTETYRYWQACKAELERRAKQYGVSEETFCDITLSHNF